jgi:hypothetical protein
VAEVRTVTAGPTRGPYERLEPDDAKVSSPVPRGLGASNGPWPPDPFNAKSFMLRNKEDGMDKHVWRILPTTILGKWSIGLIIAMPLLFVLGTSFTNSLYASIAAGDTILADIAARPALALTMLAGMGSGILAFITGILAIIKQTERAVLVYISSAIGALFILFLAGEILFPH